MTTIRPITPDDFDAWRPLWLSYNAFYGRAAATALPEAVTLATWRRFFDPAEPVHAFVAGTDGGLIGLTHYIFHRSTTSIAPICYLQDLFMAETARGQGVGRALIEAVYSEAQKSDASRVYWQTHESNETAQRLYDKVADRSGFIVYRHLLPA